MSLLIIKPFRLSWNSANEGFEMYEENSVLINTNYIIETIPVVIEPVKTIIYDINKQPCFDDFSTFLKDSKYDLLPSATIQKIIMSTQNEYVCFIRLGVLIDKHNEK